MKKNVNQLSLWEEPTPVIMHNHIEVVYQSGYRETYCTAGSYRPYRSGESVNEAGYVGQPQKPEECSICNRK